MFSSYSRSTYSFYCNTKKERKTLFYCHSDTLHCEWCKKKERVLDTKAGTSHLSLDAVHVSIQHL